MRRNEHSVATITLQTFFTGHFQDISYPVTLYILLIAFALGAQHLAEIVLHSVEQVELI